MLIQNTFNSYTFLCHAQFSKKNPSWWHAPALPDASSLIGLSNDVLFVILLYIPNLSYESKHYKIAWPLAWYIMYLWMKKYECMGESWKWVTDSSWQFCHSNDLEWQNMSFWVNFPKDNEIVIMIMISPVHLVQNLESLHLILLYFFQRWILHKVKASDQAKFFLRTGSDHHLWSFLHFWK